MGQFQNVPGPSQDAFDELNSNLTQKLTGELGNGTYGLRIAGSDGVFAPRIFLNSEKTQYISLVANNSNKTISLVYNNGNGESTLFSVQGS